MRKQKSQFSTPLKVLIAEDNKIDRKIIESMLAESLPKGSLLKAASSLSSAKKQLNKITFDIIILDLSLPDSEGLDTLTIINSMYPEVAILVNTGVYDIDQGIKTLSMGAQDFLAKGQYTPYALNKVLHFCVERKRLELALKKTYEKLKETQAQLVQSEKMKIVGGLASGVAHEVKNPLATIIYGITYLTEQLSSKNEKVDTVLVNISDAAKRANDIITDLLNFSSISQIKKESADLNDVTEKAITLLGHLFKKNKIKIIRKLEEKLPKIKIDANRIEQVLINLILNSVNAISEKGSITIKTSSKRLSKTLKEIPAAHKNGFRTNEKVVILELKDTGVGIPEDKIDQIFDPFFTTRRARGGIGLGLSVSSNIVKTHGGGIFIENMRSGGAKATLVLKA